MLAGSERREKRPGGDGEYVGGCEEGVDRAATAAGRSRLRGSVFTKFFTRNKILMSYFIA